MKNLALATILALSLLAAPLAAEAQPAGRLPKIGYLAPSSPTANAPWFDAFRQGLRQHGYVEGHNISIESRFAEGRYERLPVLVAELVDLHVDVFVVSVNRAAVAVQQATTATPIVMAVAEEPVGVGLVGSLARPGGNITGVAIVVGPEMYGKDLQFLQEVLPKRARIAALFNATSPINALWLKAAEEAARRLKVALVSTGVRSAEDFAEAFTLMKQGHVKGVVVLGEPLFYANLRRINDLAIRGGLACIWPTRDGADSGGLMSYGTNLADQYRRAATYVDKILKGERAGDLPMEQPTKFELVINLKTAKALGLTIPQSLLLRADQVIE
jgi:ABC-type uncharacterized transport system substrate-binding protein